MKNLLILILISFSLTVYAQSSEMPVVSYKGADANKPLIFYISGDGGWNSFSTNFIKGFNKAGYSVLGLNARSYFWSRKKPQDAANDISNAINQYLKAWNIKSLVLIGYSFGADVAPFIQNLFPPALSSQLQHTVLMSPSKKTDFEVHVLGMMGIANSNGRSVPDEINKLTKPLTLVFGYDENDFPIKKISVKNIQTIKLAGGHHYDGNVEEVVKQISDKIR